MKIDKLVYYCASLLEDMKVREVEIVPLKEHSLFDIFVVGTCTSARHLKSAADHMSAQCKKEKDLLVRIERGESWVALDCGRFVVHLFLEDVRQNYDLETLWSTEKMDMSSIERNLMWETNLSWDR